MIPVVPCFRCASPRGPGTETPAYTVPRTRGCAATSLFCRDKRKRRSHDRARKDGRARVERFKERYRDMLDAENQPRVLLPTPRGNRCWPVNANTRSSGRKEHLTHRLASVMATAGVSALPIANPPTPWRLPTVTRALYWISMPPLTV